MLVNSYYWKLTSFTKNGNLWSIYNNDPFYPMRGKMGHQYYFVYGAKNLMIWLKFDWGVGSYNIQCFARQSKKNIFGDFIWEIIKKLRNWPILPLITLLKVWIRCLCFDFPSFGLDTGDGFPGDLEGTGISAAPNFLPEGMFSIVWDRTDAGWSEM